MAQPSGIMRIATFNIVPKGEPMAQLNITLNQDEILQLLSADREDAFRTLLQESLNSVLKAESQEQLQAAPYERSVGRTDSRNGFRTRDLKTRIGTITLNVPRHRNQPFHTMVFENYSRREAALVTTMAEMVVSGVSTRKVARVVETLCGTSVSKSADYYGAAEPPVRTFGATPHDYWLPCFFRIQSVDFSHGDIFGWISAFNVDLVGIVGDTIHDRIGKSALAAADLLIPFFLPELGAEDRGRSLPAFMDQLKQVPGLRLGELQEQPFIDDQQDRLCVFLEYGGKVPVVPGCLQVKEQVRKADILDRIELLAGFHAEGAGHVSLSASGCAGDEDVPVLCDVFTVRHALDQGFVDLPTGVIIYRSDGSVRLFELRFADQPFEPVVFPAGILDINKHAEPVIEGDFLHGRVILLDTESVSHSGKTHFNEFVNGAFVCHDRLPP